LLERVAMLNSNSWGLFLEHGHKRPGHWRQ